MDDVTTIEAGVLRADPARDLRLGPRATREDVLESNRSGELARKRVVVFATHGLVSGEMEGVAEPALVLSPSQRAARTAP